MSDTGMKTDMTAMESMKQAMNDQQPSLYSVHYTLHVRKSTTSKEQKDRENTISNLISENNSKHT